MAKSQNGGNAKENKINIVLAGNTFDGKESRKAGDIITIDASELDWYKKKGLVAGDDAIDESKSLGQEPDSDEAERLAAEELSKLRAQAEELKIEGFAEMTKEELLKAIDEAVNE